MLYRPHFVLFNQIMFEGKVGKEIQLLFFQWKIPIEIILKSECWKRSFIEKAQSPAKSHENNNAA